VKVEEPYIRIISSDNEEQLLGLFACRLLSCPVERPQVNGQPSGVRHRRDLIDFINSLFCVEPPRTFALRYISEPSPISVPAGRIQIALFGRTEGNTEGEVSRHAKQLARDLFPVLRGSLQDYAWASVTESDEFDRLWTPFDLSSAQIAEVRRREDLVQLESLSPRPVMGRGRQSAPPASGEGTSVYVAYPFVPHAATLEGFLRILLLHPAKVIWQVSLSPVHLEAVEQDALTKQIASCERVLQQSVAGSAASILQRTRAEALCTALFDQLMRLLDAPYLLQMVMASPEPLPPTLIETAGVCVTAPVGCDPEGNLNSPPAYLHAGGYDIAVAASDQDRAVALRCLQYFDFRPWEGTFAPANLRRGRYLVDAIQASGAFRLPILTGEGTVGLPAQASRVRPVPAELASQAENSVDGLLVGTNEYLGLAHPVLLNESDRLRHVYIVGQTGTGKTTLLKTMILADLKAGNGLGVIDPHGDLFDDLMQCIPEQRQEDVVVLDPLDCDFPVGLNLLDCGADRERYLVVREMRAIMERLIEDQYGPSAAQVTGPVFYQHMQMNMLLAMSDPDNPGTLLEFYEIFQDNDYWKRWVPLKWKDQRLERWVDKVLPKTDYLERARGEITMGEYLASKFDDFIFDPRLRLIFGQKRSTLNFREIMDNRKVLLVNLAKGELTEANARFLGMVLMAKLQAAAMSRADVRPEKRKPFYLYVDEFQALATQNFTVMLSEARKFGLGLVLANQFVSQIPNERLIEALFGNVGTLICFRLGRNDADRVEPQFAPVFDSFDLINLPNWTACMKTTLRGRVVAPFTIKTTPASSEVDEKGGDLARQLSRQRYGRAREEVEKEIRESLAQRHASADKHDYLFP
jgi:hypothetical protein